MKLSVIVPVYNVERYLSRCLDSLFRQGLQDDEYEVICVNDGSTDKSGDILVDYEKKFHNMKVLTQENHGVGYARNVGMEVAQGDYITFCDSDDYIVDNGYAYLLEHFLEGVDVLCFLCKVQKEEMLNSTQEHIGGKVYFEGNGRVAYNEYFRRITSVWRIIYRHSYLKRLGVHFENIFSEDILFNFQVFRRNPLVRMTNCNIYRYMQDNSNSILRSRSRTSLVNLIDGRLKVTEVLCQASQEDGKDMIKGISYFCRSYMHRFYILSLFVNWSKNEWKQRMDLIRRIEADKFWYKSGGTSKAKLKRFILRTESYSYYAYLGLSVVLGNMLIKNKQPPSLPLI